MPRNLRILKKLSKRAAPLLPLLGYTCEQFRAEPSENYHGMTIADRRCWERSSCHPTFTGFEGRGDILFKTKDGRSMVMSPPVHPLAGTIMVGGMSGYYEPEWSEECAWGALVELVWHSFIEYDQGSDDLAPTRKLKAPCDYLRAAEELIAANRAERKW